MKKSYKNLSYKELEAERDKLRKELVDLRLQKVPNAPQDNQKGYRPSQYSYSCY